MKYVIGAVVGGVVVFIAIYLWAVWYFKDMWR